MNTEFLKVNNALLRLQILNFSRLLIKKNSLSLVECFYYGIQMWKYRDVKSGLGTGYIQEASSRWNDTSSWETSKRDLKISLGLNLNFVIINCIINHFKMPIGWAKETFDIIVSSVNRSSKCCN